uniref:16S rRNA (guanine(527)-N(7))-methyltransferase RsmG n=1 Tax=Flavobacterium sp. TaxID=239 RepID=UPI00404B4573
MDLISKYFPSLSPIQIEQFEALEGLYQEWNAKINVVSRKDIESLYLKHVLHSLSIAKIIQFKSGSKVLDVGTGGGFPGVPLAIMFPETQFKLIDVIGKKIKVVEAVVEALGLENVSAQQKRAELVTDSYDFIVSRAVTKMEEFVPWIQRAVKKKSSNDLANGVLYLKGGDLTEELQNFPKATIYDISDFFEEEFFETKKIVHLPLKKK